MATSREAVPRTFFLNEAHELASGDKSGGGRIPDYVGISWAQKGQRIGASINRVVERVQASQDPLKNKKFFVIANPVPQLEKRSVNKKKAPEGTFMEPTSYGGVHGRVFDRLGLDLLQVTADGKAIVHGDADRLNQLRTRTVGLGSLGAREQARWATIDMFDTIPAQLRVDGDWLASLRTVDSADVVFELQPMLNRLEADEVLRAISEKFTNPNLERLTGSGIDFSGRFWFRGKATLASIRAIAKDFFSVQSIHSPLFSFATAATRSISATSGRRTTIPSAPIDPKLLPCVALVDLGVPRDHIQLADACRGRFVPQGAAAQTFNDHASFVASRIVFGSYPSSSALEDAIPTCSFYDAVVGDGYENRVNDKVVMDAVRGVRGAAPDVRVFNLSIGDVRPLHAFPDVEQREKRLLMQDLDNFAFANDVLVVVAAGNSQNGVLPDAEYPNHSEDVRWGLGPWAAGFNTLVCGSYVKDISAAGLVKTVGWPSAFSRIGPGLCDAPVPSFAADGGNSSDGYQFQAGMGVWGFSGAGLAEDRPGTSHAAPILAREAALAFDTLQRFCAPGSSPYAVTVRSFLALTARQTTTDAQVQDLVKRTLGFGEASAQRIATPSSGSAVLIWQGVIETAKDVVRVQLPVPSDWLSQAGQPILRICICSDPPVNESAQALWACRKISAVLHPGPEATAIRATSHSHPTYPLIFREYKLARYAPAGERPAESDMWVLEIQYEEIFDYPAGMDFDPRQRVSFSAELIDRDPSPVDPQRALQALPFALSMTRLSVVGSASRSPVLVRTR
ncbi:S8 family serine peptidase [Polaromonas aquatica]|uniref:S8 family serine peptidase n=1 Tax=Polaromonas aquatica TaxID=332657 RepID=UPI003D6525B3